MLYVYSVATFINTYMQSYRIPTDNALNAYRMRRGKHSFYD